MYGSWLTVDPWILAHCRMCYEPMYCIYDQKIRDFCHECMMDMEAEASKEYEKKTMRHNRR
jgi:hypothetical protein